MFRRILIFCCSVGLILVLVAVLWPTAITRMINREPVLKIVDPSALATAIKDTAPQVKAIFKKAPPVSGDLVIEDIIDATNRERIKAGLQPLKVNAQLMQSSKLKTEDMIAQQYFEHVSPQGVAVEDLGKKVGYNFVVIGENLALGTFTDANDLVQAWMDSPGHRANILNPQYQDIGIDAEKGMYEGREVWFAVQHFGTGRTACPMIDNTLHDRVFAMNAELASQEQAIEALKQQLQGSDPHAAGYDDAVNKFNAMVNAYNRELTTSRDYVSQYNEQVRAFNNCLAKYQK